MAYYLKSETFIKASSTQIKQLELSTPDKIKLSNRLLFPKKAITSKCRKEQITSMNSPELGIAFF